MAPLDYLQQYRAEMEREFPIPQLCERHWKADQVWILNYPSLLRNWEKKVERTQDKNIKSEDGKKRKHEDSEPNDQKKHKLNDKAAKRSKKAGKAPERSEHVDTNHADVAISKLEVLVVRLQ